MGSLILGEESHRVVGLANDHTVHAFASQETSQNAHRASRPQCRDYAGRTHRLLGGSNGHRDVSLTAHHSCSVMPPMGHGDISEAVSTIYTPAGYPDTPSTARKG
jgi:hypothetical protein